MESDTSTAHVTGGWLQLPYGQRIGSLAPICQGLASTNEGTGPRPPPALPADRRQQFGGGGGALLGDQREFPSNAAGGDWVCQGATNRHPGFSGSKDGGIVGSTSTTYPRLGGCSAGMAAPGWLSTAGDDVGASSRVATLERQHDRTTTADERGASSSRTRWRTSTDGGRYAGGTGGESSV